MMSSEMKSLINLELSIKVTTESGFDDKVLKIEIHFYFIFDDEITSSSYNQHEFLKYLQY